MCFGGGGGSKKKPAAPATSYEANMYGDWARTKNTAFREGGPPTDQFGHPLTGDLGAPAPSANSTLQPLVS
jgi:hypothetical protein